MAAAALGLTACAPKGEVPEYPTSVSRSAHEGPWAPALAPLEAAYSENNNAEADRLVAELESQFRSTYGEDSTPYAEVRTYAALRLYDDDKVEDSLPVFRDALAHYRAALGRHPDVALALHTYADALVEAHGDAAAPEAESLYREAYAIRLASLGPAHIETIAAGSGIHDAIMRQTRLDGSNRERADQYVDELLETTEAAAPLELMSRMMVVDTLTDIALRHLEAGDNAVAMKRYLQARRRLLKLPRAMWATSHSIYPDMIEALTAEGHTLQAYIFQAEYAFVSAWSSY